MTTHNLWKNKRVLLTGHTGFKGAWLSLWLSDLGAEIHGVALEPPTEPNLFTALNLSSLLTSDNRLDIRDAAGINALVQKIQPDIVFHLAAQPLVQFSYDEPLETYAVNVMGTAHVLEAIRHCDSVNAAVIVTTDKCYDNRETMYAYCETDRLGGVDPYSSSKACTELVTAAYRASYFSASRQVALSTVRAGNVIGGGDWADNRLIPDCIRAYTTASAITLRYPHAVRPWQHVLEPLHGYILLAEKLLSKQGIQFSDAWNFGPETEDMQSVGEVATHIGRLLDIPINIPKQTEQRHEATLLQLDSTKAKKHLNWHPRWRLQQAIEETIAWYCRYIEGDNMLNFSRAQIARYLQTPLLNIVPVENDNLIDAIVEAE